MLRAGVSSVLRTGGTGTETRTSSSTGGVGMTTTGVSSGVGAGVGDVSSGVLTGVLAAGVSSCWVGAGLEEEDSSVAAGGALVPLVSPSGLGEALEGASSGALDPSDEGSCVAPAA